jgi:hypothetical protein
MLTMPSRITKDVQRTDSDAHIRSAQQKLEHKPSFS